MKIVIAVQSFVIVVLAIALVHQIRQRSVAGDLLARSSFIRTANAQADESVGREDNAFETNLRSLLEENRRLRQENADTRQQSPSEVKISDLKEVLVRLPEQAIPELQFASEADWYAAVDGPLETVEDFRRALGRLRAAAEGRFARRVQPALAAFLSANHDEFPKDVSQLESYFGDPVDHAVIRRYAIVPAAEVSNVRVGGEWAITQRQEILPKVVDGG